MKIPSSLVLLGFLALAAMSRAEPAPYSLTTCVVSGDKLGAMGSPVTIMYHGEEVRFCCHDCVASFHENPTKYLAKLKEAAQKQ